MILNGGFKIFNFEYVKFGESSARGDYNKAQFKAHFQAAVPKGAAAVLIVDGEFTLTNGASH